MNTKILVLGRKFEDCKLLGGTEITLSIMWWEQGSGYSARITGVRRQF